MADRLRDDSGDRTDTNRTDVRGQLALVYPIRKGSPMTTTETSTVASGETLDPAAALAFVTAMADVGKKIQIEIEQSVATLTERGVAGEPVDLLNRMREAAQTFVADSESAKVHFQRHLATQDSLLSDNTLAGTVAGTYVGTRS
jgi:hypothetical protein